MFRLSLAKEDRWRFISRTSGCSWWVRLEAAAQQLRELSPRLVPAYALRVAPARNSIRSRAKWGNFERARLSRQRCDPALFPNGGRVRSCRDRRGVDQEWPCCGHADGRGASFDKQQVLGRLPHCPCRQNRRGRFYHFHLGFAVLAADGRRRATRCDQRRHRGACPRPRIGARPRRAEPAVGCRHHLRADGERFSIWRSCWTRRAERSSAGQWPIICAPSWWWMR